MTRKESERKKGRKKGRKKERERDEETFPSLFHPTLASLKCLFMTVLEASPSLRIVNHSASSEASHFRIRSVAVPCSDQLDSSATSAVWWRHWESSGRLFNDSNSHANDRSCKLMEIDERPRQHVNDRQTGSIDSWRSFYLTVSLRHRPPSIHTDQYTFIYYI